MSISVERSVFASVNEVLNRLVKISDFAKTHELDVENLDQKTKESMKVVIESFGSSNLLKFLIDEKNFVACPKEINDILSDALIKIYLVLTKMDLENQKKDKIEESLETGDLTPKMLKKSQSNESVISTPGKPEPIVEVTKAQVIPPVAEVPKETMKESPRDIPKEVPTVDVKESPRNAAKEVPAVISKATEKEKRELWIDQVEKEDVRLENVYNEEKHTAEETCEENDSEEEKQIVPYEPPKKIRVVPSPKIFSSDHIKQNILNLLARDKYPVMFNLDTEEMITKYHRSICNAKGYYCSVATLLGYHIKDDPCNQSAYFTVRFPGKNGDRLVHLPICEIPKGANQRGGWFYRYENDPVTDVYIDGKRVRSKGDISFTLFDFEYCLVWKKETDEFLWYLAHHNEYTKVNKGPFYHSDYYHPVDPEVVLDAYISYITPLE